MKRAAAFAWLLVIGVRCALAIDPLPFKDRAEEQRFQHLAKELRCLVCQNQNLADSDADLAKDLREQVFTMMQSGKSDDEIKSYLVSRYNDFVLYDPPVKPGTWLLWFTPGVLVLIGAGVLINILRKRARQDQWGQIPLTTPDGSNSGNLRSLTESDPIDPEEDW
jgi:cytochrome c-type biogenesis protein CcmH